MARALYAIPILLTLSLLLTIACGSDEYVVPEPNSAPTDRGALIALHSATDGSDWKLRKGWLNNSISDGNWLTDEPIDGWLGVEANRHSRVIWLDLSDKGLNGEISPELGSLSNLKALDLSGNELSGEIPPELGKLSKLKSLYLNDNELSGCVPSNLRSQLSNNYNIGKLYFCLTDRDALIALYSATSGYNWWSADNWLTHEPIGQWHGVKTDRRGRVIELDLRSNGLSGEIPSKLVNLSKLERLDLSDNELSGEIPLELGKLSKLKSLILSWNQLRWEIPSELGDLSKLERLELRDNELSGEIPPELGNLSELQLLDLYGNELSAEIPLALGDLYNLEHLWLDDNELSGCAPSSLQSQLRTRIIGELSFCPEG